MANTLAKQVTASLAVNASSAPEIAKTILIGVEVRLRLEPLDVRKEAEWPAIRAGA